MGKFIDLLSGVEDDKQVSMLELLTDPSHRVTLELALAERGFNERADIVYQTLDGADLNQMWAEFQEILTIREAQRNRVIDWLTFPVTTPIEQIRYPTADDFEEASEYGQPKSVRLSTPYNLGYDFRWYDLAMRFTWMFISESTQAQVEALHAQAMEADNRLMMNKVLKCLFNPLNLQSSMGNVPVPVYKFWNGDGIVPPYYKTYTFDGTHNHYLTSGTTAISSAQIQAMETHLYHHGYSVFNGYKMLLLVNRTEGLLLRAARVTNGWEYDFIPGANNGGGVFLNSFAPLVGQPEGSTMPGSIGTYGPFVVIEEDYMPVGYVTALASGGTEDLNNPIGMREHVNGSLRGLMLMPGDTNDYPVLGSFYRHGFGTGVRHRGGGVVSQVTTNATYTVPAAYV